MKIYFEITYRGETVNLSETASQMVVSFTLYDGNFPNGGGGGAVDSVNGKTGTVVLNADDIAETSTRKWLTATLNGYYDSAYAWVNTNGANVLQSISELTTAIGGKVDKVTGYGLSKNDFTDALKNAYDGAVTNATNAVNWISSNGTNLLNHLVNTSNPHNTTASQVGAYTTSQVDTALGLKADKSAVLCLVGEYLPNTTLTGTTAETSLGYILIPANTYSAGKTVWVDSLLLRATGTSTIVARMRISTSATPTIASATLLATNNIANTTQYAPFVRTNIHVDSLTSTKMYNAATAVIQDNANSATITDLNIDWTVDQYIHVSAQLITSGDSITLHKLRIFL